MDIQHNFYSEKRRRNARKNSSSEGCILHDNEPTPCSREELLEIAEYAHMIAEIHKLDVTITQSAHSLEITLLGDTMFLSRAANIDCLNLLIIIVRRCSCLMLSGADDYGEHLFRLFMRVPLA